MSKITIANTLHIEVDQPLCTFYTQNGFWIAVQIYSYTCSSSSNNIYRQLYYNTLWQYYYYYFYSTCSVLLLRFFWFKHTNTKLYGKVFFIYVICMDTCKCKCEPETRRMIKKNVHSDREVFLREIQFHPYIYNYILRVYFVHSPVITECALFISNEQPWKSVFV